MPDSGAAGVDVSGVPINIKSKGRMAENNATCPADIAADPGCAPSAPYLALNPGPNSKWRFEPAGGGAMRYYISQDVSVRAIAMHPHHHRLESMAGQPRELSCSLRRLEPNPAAHANIWASAEAAPKSGRSWSHWATPAPACCGWWSQCCQCPLQLQAHR